MTAAQGKAVDDQSVCQWWVKKSAHGFEMGLVIGQEFNYIGWFEMKMYSLS
jgi:hypothetical protein